MKFKKIFLEALVYDELDPKVCRIVKDTIEYVGRTSVIHKLIFEKKGKYYAVSYTEGLAGYNDVPPFEYEPDDIECAEYRAVRKTLMVYEPIND